MIDISPHSWSGAMTDKDFERFEQIMYDISEERYRQVAILGYNKAHDDTYNMEGQLARAACTYADGAAYRLKTGHTLTEPFLWPWKDQVVNLEDAEASLIKAAALCIAQVEQIRRKNNE